MVYMVYKIYPLIYLATIKMFCRLRHLLSTDHVLRLEAQGQAPWQRGAKQRVEQYDVGVVAEEFEASEPLLLLRRRFLKDLLTKLLT